MIKRNKTLNLNYKSLAKGKFSKENLKKFKEEIEELDDNDLEWQLIVDEEEGTRNYFGEQLAVTMTSSTLSFLIGFLIRIKDNSYFEGIMIALFILFAISVTIPLTMKLYDVPKMRAYYQYKLLFAELERRKAEIIKRRNLQNIEGEQK